jgi:predicted nucleic acid-binding protein
MSVPQIVLDTNVLVAGLRSNRGASFRVLQLVGTGRFEINLSVPLVLEYEDVLMRSRHSIGLSTADVGDFLDFLCRTGRHHEVFYLWRPLLPDPKDEMLLEVAVKAGCRHIVTFNQRDFRGAEAFGVAAVRPHAFLATLRTP